MAVNLRKQWRHFKAMPSGRRFQTRYRMRGSDSGGVTRKVLMCGLGGLVVLAGVIMLVLPGPGMLAILVGATVIAEESLFAARVLDRIDLWATGVYTRWRARRTLRK